jgi:hypothetical protein
MDQTRRFESWDARPIWTGIAKAVLFSAAVWVLIAAVALAL